MRCGLLGALGALALIATHMLTADLRGEANKVHKEPIKMRELLMDASRANGKVVWIGLDGTGGRFRAMEVLHDAAFFNATTKGDYLYRSRGGSWFIGKARGSSSAVPITPPAGNPEYAALSPDGRLVLWVYQNDTISTMIITQASGPGARQIKRESGIIRVPSWSPQSSEIVYYFGNPNVLQTDEFTLRVISVDGSHEKHLAPPSQATGITADRARPPLWSPDGTRILFVANYQGDNLVRDYAYVVQADGRGAIRLVEGGVWSDDGTKLLGVKRTALPFGPFVLSVFDVLNGSSHPTNLGFDLPASAPNGRWSPDGEAFAFITNDNQLQLVDVERKTKTKIVDFDEGANLIWLVPE
jgi:Tol biopolymer transport system component